MADTDTAYESPRASIRDRIAALNLDQVGQPSAAPPPRPNSVRPPPPPVPGAPHARPAAPAVPRSQSVATIPVIQPHYGEAISNHGQAYNTSIGNQPRIARPPPPPPPSQPPRATQNDSRRPSDQQMRPALPPRTPSGQSLTRTVSRDSMTSTTSANSSTSYLATVTPTHSTSRRPSADASNRARAPPYDPNAQTLPTLPTRRTSSTHSMPPIPVASSPPPPKTPLRPSDGNGYTRPTLPQRPSMLKEQQTLTYVEPQPVSVAPPNVMPSVTRSSAKPKQSALSFGMNKGTENAPAMPARPLSTTPTQPPRPAMPSIPSNGSLSTNGSAPPPIPISSRPNLAQLAASKPTATSIKPAHGTPPSLASAASCLWCRDFSAPDNHAAAFPRDQLPSTDLAWLSHQLTSPFPSLTDKARALFTWLHHNVDYDVVSFFSHNVRPSTPASTLHSGLAVCEGYAGLFAALAMHAGLEAIVVGGAGKGFSHRALAANDPIPPFASNHAWNAVKLDNDEWKLIDACWGAGYIQGPNLPYKRHFSPEFFAMSNAMFSFRHFPADPHQFFLPPDHPSICWSMFSQGPDGPGEALQVYTGCLSEHGIEETTIQPRKKHIAIKSYPPRARMHFQMQRVCSHPAKRKPYPYVLSVGGRDGRKREELPFQTDGFMWWLDVDVAQLGCAGQAVSLYAVTKIGDRAGRGFRAEDYARERRLGKGVQFAGVAAWELV